MQNTSAALIEDGITVELKTKEITDSAQELLDETGELINDLGKQEKTILQRIVLSEQPLTVADAAPGFIRENDKHNSLRKLRQCQLVRPIKGGRFQEHKRLEIKSFGKVLLKIYNERLLQPGD